MNNLKLFCCAVLLISLPVMAIIYINQRSNADNFSCVGNYYSKSHDHILRARISLIFYHGQGESVFDGEGIDDAGKVQNIRIASQFTWQRRSNFYHITNATTSKLLANSLDAESTVKNVPFYFLESGREINLRIFADRTSSYLFTNGDIPIFYCKGR